MQGLNGADISTVRWGVWYEMLTGFEIKTSCCRLLAWYVKRSTLSVLVCSKEKEKRTKKEKEITPSKKVAVCRLPEFLKERKKSSKRKIENNLVIQQFKYLKLLVY